MNCEGAEISAGGVKDVDILLTPFEGINVAKEGARTGVRFLRP